MKDILKQADNVASSHTSIIIIGEFGSGRSWLAKRIHQRGDRSNKPFLKVNCRIIEGHEALKKIFGCLTLSETGTRVSHGSLEQCQGGTVFFENFDNLPENVQQRVMKAPGSHQIQRVGSRQAVEIDQPRIICSIEIKPSHILYKEEFLTDTILDNDPYIIGLPSLRQRREDIAPLIQMFLNRQFRNRPEVATKKISPEAVYLCIKHDWPGNVRQLKNAIEHAAITSEHDIIRPEDLPISIKTGRSENDRVKHLEKSHSYINAERQLIKSVLAEIDSREEAAELLGIDHASLFAKMERFELLTDHQKLEINHQDLKS